MQDHGRQRLRVLAQQRERVVLRGPRVDHERQRRARAPARAAPRTRAAGPRAGRSRGSSRGRSRRSPDRAGRPRRARSPRGRPSPKPSASCGWRPTIANTSSCSWAAARARSIDGPFMPTVASRVTPAARARSTSSPSGGSQESRWQWVSTTGGGAQTVVASEASTRGNSCPSSDVAAPPGSAPKRAFSSDGSSLPSAASSRSADVRHERRAGAPRPRAGPRRGE